MDKRYKAFHKNSVRELEVKLEAKSFARILLKTKNNRIYKKNLKKFVEIQNA